MINEFNCFKLILPPFFDHYTTGQSLGSPENMIDNYLLLERLDVIDVNHKLSDICDGKSEVRIDFTGVRNPVRNATLEWFGIDKDKFEKTEKKEMLKVGLGLRGFTEYVKNEMSRSENCIYLENPFYLMHWNGYKSKTDINQQNFIPLKRGEIIIK